MTDIEFNKSLRELNKAYKELFNTIPCISDYSCSRDEYVKALKKSIEKKIKLSDILTEIKVSIDKETIL